jgi:hypothetical protein
MCDPFTRRVSRPSLECLCHPPPYKVCWWARGWLVVGDGPSYLLFRAEEKKVTHLVSRAIPRYLHTALKGFHAIENDKLVPLVRDLMRINTANVDDPDCRLAGEAVLSEIERLIYLPEQKIFDAQLGRLVSLIKAARRLQLYHGVEFLRSVDVEGSIFTLCDSHGNEVLMGDVGAEPKRVYRCVPHSKIADCARELLNQEPADCSALYCVPTRKELREYLNADEPRVTHTCQDEGFDWLPRATRQA